MTALAEKLKARIAATGPLALMLLYLEWRTLFVILGVFAIGLALVSWWRVRDKPEDLGFPSVREMEGLDAHAPRSRHWFHDLRAVLVR